MTRFALHRAVLIAGLGSLLLAGSIRLDAQNNGQKTSEQPTFRAGANFVRVDVYPTIKGAAVRDLTQPDFDILEDGVPQKIESFEYVNVRGAGPEAEQHEPNTVAEARQIAETTKGRLFVIFLDTYFVDVAGSHRLQRTLVNFLHRILGPDDMYAVMTPEMSALDISFARRTDTIEGYLSKYWFWGSAIGSFLQTLLSSRTISAFRTTICTRSSQASPRRWFCGGASVRCSARSRICPSTCGASARSARLSSP